VPSPLALDTERGWMLLPDAGVSLADTLKSDKDIRHWEAALRNYGALQFTLNTRTQSLLAVGIPDQRPKIMHLHLEEMLTDSSLLRLGKPGGLTRESYQALYRMLPKFLTWCEELSESGIRPTVQHDDLHAANIFVKDTKFTFIDWADACISHPFCSLVYPRRAVMETFGLAPEDRAARRVWDAYLEPWSSLHDVRTLLQITGVALRVACVGRALAWHRALTGVERHRLMTYQAAPEARWLAHLLSLSET
jgi:hypothetical protein